MWKTLYVNDAYNAYYVALARINALKLLLESVIQSASMTDKVVIGNNCADAYLFTSIIIPVP